VLENTDHRQFRLSKEKVDIAASVRNPNNHDSDEVISKSTYDSINQNDEEINKTIAYFKISENLDITTFYEKYPQYVNRETDDKVDEIDDVTEDRYRWGLDISNVQKYQDDKYFILIAVSRIDVKEDMKGKENADTKSDYKKNTIKKRYERVNEISISDVVRLNVSDCKSIEIKKETEYKPNEIKKGTAVYRLKLIKDIDDHYALKLCPVNYYYSDSVSGICKFIQNLDDIDHTNHYTLKRFIVLNFNGIYNFEYDFDYRSLDLNTRFDYPKSIENELEHWHKENLEDCMDKLLTCLYNQYFLVEQYKNNVQTLEGKTS
jgi:hypothetical protein